MPAASTPLFGRQFWALLFWGLSIRVGVFALLVSSWLTFSASQLSGQLPDSNISSRREVSTAPSKSTENVVDAASIQSLIQQLGADDFVDRELAEMEIVKLGGAALESLKQACSPQSPYADAEIRLRAQRLLVLIHRDDFRKREGRFLTAEPTDLEDFGFAGWREFSKIVGSSRDSRRLFMEMYQSQENLFLAFACGKSELQQEMDNRESNRLVSSRSSGRLLSRLCGKMFLSSHQFSGAGSQPGVIQFEKRELAKICTQLCDAENLAYVRSCPHTSAIEKLVDHWFMTVVVQSEVAIDSRLDVLEEFDLTNQLDFLIAIVVDSHQLMENRQRAILSVAKLGSGKELKLLSPLLKETSLVGHFPHPDLDNEGLEVQFRDLVLASCIHLVGADPVEFGFLGSPNEGETNKFPFDATRLGFVDPSSRERAFSKWFSIRGGISE